MGGGHADNRKGFAGDDCVHRHDLWRVCGGHAAQGAGRPVLFSWTGCYAGVNGGWDFRRDRFQLRPSGNYANPLVVTQPPNLAGTGDFPANLAFLTTNYSQSGSGATVGGTFGCQEQRGSWVYGLEGDVNWSNARTTVDAAIAQSLDQGNLGFINPAHTEHVTNTLQGFATIRGRIGFASDRFLAYVTGGAALGVYKSETAVLFQTLGGNVVYNGAQHIGSDTFHRFGGTVGAGAEYAFTNNWSFKVEYLALIFIQRDRNYSSPLVAAAVPFAPGYSWGTTINTTTEHIVRAGLNFKFGP
jgi:outer membrane immunogenic protein